MKRFSLLITDGPAGATDGPVLALHPVAAPELSAFGTVDCVQPDKAAAEGLIAAGHTVIDAARGPYALAMVLIGRSRDANRGLIAEAWSHTRPGGIVAMSGNKTDGIDALARALAAEGLDPASRPRAHGKLVWLVRGDTVPPFLDAWRAAAGPRKEAAGFWTMPGLFSADRIDPGSKFLADNLPPGLSGHAADLGAGWGYLAARILAAAPALASLALVETDRRALDLARRNVTDPRAAFMWADATRSAGLPRGLDVVVMNPPFHDGRADAPDLGRAFIETAADLLSPKGRLFLVANRHLPYERKLRERFRTVTTHADAGKYKILAAGGPTARSRHR